MTNVFGCGRVVGGRETRHTFSLNQVLFLLFEHDPEYGLSFKKIIDLLKPGGLFCFTYASTGRDEHGTLRTTPREIGGVKGFGDYYKNLTISDVKEVIDVDSVFYFVGIKRRRRTFLHTKSILEMV